MKELTIEEKAKAYDNLLERLKEMYNDNKTNIVSRLTYERYFPELKNKESEDEKIRKELIEQVIYIVPDKNEVDDNGNTLPCYTTRINKYIAWLEKQGEQKPTDKVEPEPKFKVGDYIERKDGLGCHLKIIFVGGNVYGCEKLIYSEDSSPFFDIMFKNQDEFKISSDFEQKSAEWSEEDEKMLADACIMLDWYKGNNWWTAQYIKDWLKSLRSQKQWKPSNEQIVALEHFVRSIGESGYASPYDNNTKLLYSLLEQLKKLKE